MTSRQISLGVSSLALLACVTAAPPPARAPTSPAPTAAQPQAPPPTGPASTTPLATTANPAPPATPDLAWPTEVPPLAGAQLLEHARISARVGDSPRGATFIAVRGELQQIFAAWLDAAAARGFRVLAERGTTHVRAASLIDGDGRRASLLLQRDGDDELAGVFNFGHHPQTTLRGPCVPIPTHFREFVVERQGIDQDGQGRAERVRARVEARLGQDLDGDGELDVLVPTDARATCPQDITWTVYLARGACGHAVGVVGPGEIELYDDPLPPGPRPLVFRAQTQALTDEGLMTTTIVSTYSFRGGRYVRTDRARERWGCHHCPLETCTP